MACRGDEVEHGMDSVIPEAGVTLDTRLLGQDIIILSLEVSDDLCKAVWYEVSNVDVKETKGCLSLPGFVVDLVTKSRGVHNCQ